jgi:hypothetical protein
MFDDVRFMFGIITEISFLIIGIPRHALITKQLSKIKNELGKIGATITFYQSFNDPA